MTVPLPRTWTALYPDPTIPCSSPLLSRHLAESWHLPNRWELPGELASAVDITPLQNPPAIIHSKLRSMWALLLPAMLERRCRYGSNHSQSTFAARRWCAPDEVVCKRKTVFAKQLLVIPKAICKSFAIILDYALHFLEL